MLYDYGVIYIIVTNNKYFKVRLGYNLKQRKQIWESWYFSISSNLYSFYFN